MIWADWTSGTAGANGSATGVFDLGGGNTIGIQYTGEIQFIQTAGGTNYWTGPVGTYEVPGVVDNRPGTPDIIALSAATSKTLTFTQAIDNLFFAVVSLNGNGYEFNEDFSIVTFGLGYWGNGTLTRQDMGNSTYRLIGSGEPHGVIRFNRPVDSITWTSLTAENWNGFTIGTYGAAPPPVDPSVIPVPASLLLGLSGLAGLLVTARRRRVA